MEITNLLLICGLLESVGCFLPYLGSFKPLFTSELSLLPSPPFTLAKAAPETTPPTLPRSQKGPNFLVIHVIGVLERKKVEQRKF